MFKSLTLGLKNIYRWFPVIWKDRDWDNFYIEHILYHKLVNTHNFLISDDAVTNWDAEAHQKAVKALRVCIGILERRMSYFYVGLCSNIYEEHIIRLSYEIEDRDQKLLGKLIGLYLSYWWD